MTILQPYQSTRRFNIPLTGVLLLIAAFGVLSVYFYNQNVEHRHALNDGLKKLQAMEAVNADLKNQLYQTLDTARIEAVATERNLIKDKNPQYLETSLETIASN